MPGHTVYHTTNDYPPNNGVDPYRGRFYPEATTNFFSWPSSVGRFTRVHPDTCAWEQALNTSLTQHRISNHRALPSSEQTSTALVPAQRSTAAAWSSCTEHEGCRCHTTSQRAIQSSCTGHNRQSAVSLQERAHIHHCPRDTPTPRTSSPEPESTSTRQSQQQQPINLHLHVYPNIRSSSRSPSRSPHHAAHSHSHSNHGPQEIVLHRIDPSHTTVDQFLWLVSNGESRASFRNRDGERCSCRHRQGQCERTEEQIWVGRS